MGNRQIPSCFTTIIPSNTSSTTWTWKTILVSKPTFHEPLSLNLVHLHGHTFQVLYRSKMDSGPYDQSMAMDFTFPKNPIRRDTVMIHRNGFAILRFRTNNPGVWLVIVFYVRR